MGDEPKIKNPKNEFELWKSYEDIAMHFNDLLIQLRMRALGGIAIITAIVGFVSKGDTSEDFRWGLMFAVFCLLMIVWLAIAALDVRYYSRLLRGAVSAITELEKNKIETENGTVINLSTEIEKAVLKGNRDRPFLRFISDGRLHFYIIVFFALLFGAYGSLDQHCKRKLENEFVLKQCMCFITPHRLFGQSDPIILPEKPISATPRFQENPQEKNQNTIPDSSR